MADAPPADDTSQRLALVQQMWRELQAARKDPLQYNDLSKRIRRESDLVRQRDYAYKPES